MQTDRVQELHSRDEVREVLRSEDDFHVRTSRFGTSTCLPLSRRPGLVGNPCLVEVRLCDLDSVLHEVELLGGAVVLVGGDSQLLVELVSWARNASRRACCSERRLRKARLGVDRSRDCRAACRRLPRGRRGVGLSGRGVGAGLGAARGEEQVRVQGEERCLRRQTRWTAAVPMRTQRGEASQRYRGSNHSHVLCAFPVPANLVSRPLPHSSDNQVQL